MPPVLGAHNPGQRNFFLHLHTRYATQQAILEDIVASCAQGIKADYIKVTAGIISKE